MRLIDADVLRTSIEKDRDASDMPKMWYEGIEYAINHIIHAPTVDGPEKNVGKWIPVTERLPEVGKFVLVNDIYMDESTIAKLLEDKGWEDQHGNWSSFGCVSAWCELPNKYREGAEDG